MLQLWLWVGRLTGFAGATLTIVSFVTRLMSHWHIAGFQVGTVLLAGVALMVMAVLAYVIVLAERPRP